MHRLGHYHSFPRLLPAHVCYCQQTLTDGWGLSKVNWPVCSRADSGDIRWRGVGSPISLFAEFSPSPRHRPAHLTSTALIPQSIACASHLGSIQHLLEMSRPGPATSQGSAPATGASPAKPDRSAALLAAEARLKGLSNPGTTSPSPPPPSQTPKEEAWTPPTDKQERELRIQFARALDRGIVRDNNYQTSATCVEVSSGTFDVEPMCWLMRTDIAQDRQ